MSRPPLRLSVTADKKGMSLTSGGPAPVDPETGLTYPILKIWGLPDQNQTTGLSDEIGQAVPDSWSGVGGEVRIRVDDSGGAHDKRIIAVGLQPVYLNLGQYADVKVNTRRVANSNAPLCAQWLRSMPAGVLMDRLQAPTLVSTAVPSSELFLPNGATRMKTSVGLTVRFRDFGTNPPAGSTAIAIIKVTAADTWIDIPKSAGSFKISEAADVFFELDPL